MINEGITVTEDLLNRLAEQCKSSVAENIKLEYELLKFPSDYENLPQSPFSQILRSKLRPYLVERFRKNNIPKYHQYCEQWIENTTRDQLLYYREEKRRLETGAVLR